MHAAPPLRPERGVPVVAVAVLASLLLHAVLIAWPRWPTWNRAPGIFDGTDVPLHARLTGRTPSEDGSEPGTSATGLRAAGTTESRAAGVSAEAARRLVSVPVAAAADAAAAVVEPPASASPGSAATPRLASNPVDAGRGPRIVLRAAAPEHPTARTARADPPRGEQGKRGEKPRIEPTSAHAEGGASGVAQEPGAVAGAAMPVAVAAPPSTQRIEPARAARSDSGERADIASVAQYRIALISVSRRYKPSEAVLPAERPEGRVDVQLAIAADGSLADARVTRSSGQPLLDALALDMMRSAKAQAPVPARLLDRAFEIEVPVIFAGAGAPR
jgi:protein TonB